MAIADAYDAMIHDRPYKRAISHDQAIAELRRHAGTQFDPELVNLFCDLYASRAPEADPRVMAVTEPPTTAALVVPEPRRRAVRRAATGRSGSALATSSGGAGASVTFGADMRGDVAMDDAHDLLARHDSIDADPHEAHGAAG